MSDMTEDEFFEKHKPIESPDGSTIWQREELVVNGKSRYPDNQVWTYVCDEVDGAIAGWHVVNMVGYIVTEVPWVDGGESMTFDEVCTICHRTIRMDDEGTWVDDTGGDVCMDNSGTDRTHSPHEEDEDEDGADCCQERTTSGGCDGH